MSGAQADFAELAGRNGRWRALPDGQGKYRIAAEDARSVLAAMRAGPVRIRFGTGPAAMLDTNGLDPALAHFDREQEVEGTSAALILRNGGTLGDYAHPVAPDAPTVKLRTAQPVEAPHDARWERAEGPCARGVPGSALTSAWRLDARTVLIQRPCPLPDSPTQWFIDRKGDPNPRPIEWPGEPRPNRGSKGVLHGAVFDASRATVRSIRHIGAREDCGVSEAWAWDGESFVLIDRREMPVCRGIPKHAWIRSFRADTISP